MMWVLPSARKAVGGAGTTTLSGGSMGRGGGVGAFACSGAFPVSCAMAIPARDVESQPRAVRRFISRILSEPQFQRKLNDARIHRCCQNAPEARRCERGGRIPELRMIQRVEKLGAKLQPHAIRPRRDGELVKN